MDKELKFAIKVAKDAGAKLLSYAGKVDISTRGGSKEVKTSYDKIADKLIKDAIEKNFPTHSYLTEETGMVEKDKKYLWVIDPLDGTANFMSANPFFSVSVSFWVDGEPVIGVIEAPRLQERYIAAKGKGAWLVNLKNNKKIRAKVSDNNDFFRSYIVSCEGGEKDNKKVARIIGQIYPQVKDFRKIGSAAIELAWVGLGRADAYISPQIKIWDIASGVVFVKEAGGAILDFNGKPYNLKEMGKLYNINLVATNGKIKVPAIK